MCRFYALFVGAAVAALPGCGTQEISADPDRFTYISGQTSPDQSLLTIAFAPTAPTFEQQQSGPGNTTAYQMAVDGKQLVSLDSEGQRWPQVVAEGGESSFGFLAPGRHHFTINSTTDGHTIFDGDHDIPAASSTYLYLFGDHPDALQSRWMSVPLIPAAGTQRVAVLNLVRGQSIELVSCADVAASGCTAVSPPLARGESFDSDFPLSPNAIGFRQVPTDAVPAPPVQLLTPFLLADPLTRMLVPTSIVAAPLYMSPQGDIWSYFL